MIAKLRIKFIAISTVAVLLVIAVLLGLVNSVMYHRTLDDVYKIANYIAENDGEMPESQMKKSPDFTDEDIYRIRFFTVKADSDGNVISSDLGRIHSVSDSDIKTFITSVQKDNGHIETDGDAFAYVVKSTSYGKIIVFVNCTNELRTAENFREASLLLGLVCLLVFVIVVSILSRRAVQPVIRNMESQKQFITNASHELKTPLAVISANTEVIEMSYGESEWTKSTLNQVGRLNTLIGELITISKFGEKDKKELTQVNVSEIVINSAYDIKTVITNHGKEFAADIAENITVKADSEGIRQITGILLDNAAKYCDDGGKVTAKLTHKGAGKGMKLAVSNTYAEGK